MKKRIHRAHVLVPLAALLALAAVSERATELRNLGLAQLENEKPAEAVGTFEALTREAPQEPLGWADLAVAHLRVQQVDRATAAIEKALSLAPGDARLLAIRGDIEQWEGRHAAALATYVQAARAAPDDVRVQYALYRLATTLDGEEAEQAIDLALGNLARLRPDNVVVMLHQGQRAVERGDRSAATSAFLRVRELLWQAPPIAERALEMLLETLESGEPGAARTPAQRLANVLVVTPMYQQGLRELSIGIQGVPLERFREEAPPSSFGEPAKVRFEGAPVAPGSIVGDALVAGDLDGDERPDLAWVAAPSDGRPARLMVSLSTAHGVTPRGETPGADRLLVFDLDNDGALDLLAYGAGATFLFQGEPGGGLRPTTETFGLEGATGTAAVALDFDIEGDLDLVVAGGDPQPRLYRNNLAGALEELGAKSLAPLPTGSVHDLLASDLDRDGDLDLLFAHAEGLTWYDNLRQGEFVDRSADLASAAGLVARAVESADLDNDGWPDLILAGNGVTLLHNIGGRFEPWDLGEKLRTPARFDDVVALDADNDGRLDLALAGEAGTVVAAQRGGSRNASFAFLPVEGGPAETTAIVAADLDADGDLDLVVAGPGGVDQLLNHGGDDNHWLAIRTRGLTKGNSKNNLFGLGSTIEVLNGTAYQFREVDGDVTHFGLGTQDEADIVRILWTNGVPQNRLDLGADQTIVEEQVLKGSCPFLYAWDGERIAFVTDLLWGAPIGLPLAPGRWTPGDPSELVHAPRAVPVDGRYELRITEELWEAAFFDRVRLWVVDYPTEVEPASSLKILPGEEIPERVLATRELRPLAAAWDGRGREVTERVARRDEVYADGFAESPYQGVAAEPWSFTFDLGEAPAGPVRLHLDGWIFPADASLNLAVAQRPDLGAAPPRLEVETADGWRVLMPAMGFPAGKTKTMVVDTPPLPAGAHRLRIVTGQWISWDRIVWSTAPADDEVRVVARLEPASAELRYRGFSRLVRRAPNAPHGFDYAEVATESPWLPFPGRYTRYGDVRELLVEGDDRYVVMAAGDEIAVVFDAGSLLAPEPGYERTVFLESYGWDKDADRNTGEGLRVGPLPYRDMSSYPYGPNDVYPAELEAYVERWLTRRVRPATTLVTASALDETRADP